MKSLLAVVLSAGVLTSANTGGAVESHVPLLGAQVWIEPGQTPEQIDRWFATLAENHMPLARVFLSWNYLEPRRDRWDFSLYDAAFRAAEKYGVRIVATLTPDFGPTHRGFWYRTQGASIVRTPTRLKEAAVYIRQVVEHFKSSPALDAWMPMNEPGQPPSPDSLAVSRFREWLRNRYGTIDSLNAAWLTDFRDFSEINYDERWTAGGFTWPVSFVDWYTFWREHLAWYLSWVATQIRSHDPDHPIHVNPHALVSNLAQRSYNLPSWRAFLNSLGASIHPAWHFGLLGRNQFALGVSYVCDLIHGSSEPNPFWVTELQGGNNLYSSTRPLCPTEQDIAQWVWTAVGSGAERVIFWLLNARAKAGEAGEWSLLDFQGRPSERLRTASRIARLIQDNADFFAGAKTVQAPVTVALSLETMTLQHFYHRDDFPGRGRNAHFLSALAFYQAFAELGVPVRIKHVHDIPWEKGTTGQLVVLPHVTALTREEAKQMADFVARGNTLLVTGLTGFYDPEGRCWPLDGFPLGEVLGARLKEVRLIDQIFRVQLDQPQVNLPAHLWEGEIEPDSAEVIGETNGRITAVRSRYGRGTVVWIPSLVGLGAWLTDVGPLSQFLLETARPWLDQVPVHFQSRAPDCLLRSLVSDDALLVVVTNGGDREQICRLRLTESRQDQPEVLWGRRDSVQEGGRVIILGPRETVVLLWP